ncbi:MAG: Ldh family oxidoreductase, partial [Chloroflexota bacterium]
MLEQFHVPDAQAHHVNHEDLKETSAQLLEKSGVPEEDARLAADVLVSADLRGVETHGVSNILRGYI